MVHIRGSKVQQVRDGPTVLTQHRIKVEPAGELSCTLVLLVVQHWLQSELRTSLQKDLEASRLSS